MGVSLPCRISATHTYNVEFSESEIVTANGDLSAGPEETNTHALQHTAYSVLNDVRVTTLESVDRFSTDREAGPCPIAAVILWASCCSGTLQSIVAAPVDISGISKTIPKATRRPCANRGVRLIEFRMAFGIGQ